MKIVPLTAILVCATTTMIAADSGLQFDQFKSKGFDRFDPYVVKPFGDGGLNKPAYVDWQKYLEHVMSRPHYSPDYAPQTLNPGGAVGWELAPPKPRDILGAMIKTKTLKIGTKAIGLANEQGQNVSFAFDANATTRSIELAANELRTIECDPCADAKLRIKSAGRVVEIPVKTGSIVFLSADANGWTATAVD